MKNKLSATQIPDCIWEAMGIPAPVREYKFHPKRRWRIDFAWPNIKLAIEIEGGAFVEGRHTRPIGFSKDIEKYNNLTLMGWYLFRFLPNKVDYDMIKELMLRLY